MSVPPSSSTLAVAAKHYPAVEKQASLPVTRAMFDELMVPCFAPAPFIPVRGSGSRMWDQQGRMCIAFASGVAVTALGRWHPATVNALAAHAQTSSHVSNGT